MPLLPAAAGVATKASSTATYNRPFGFGKHKGVKKCGYQGFIKKIKTAIKNGGLFSAVVFLSFALGLYHKQRFLSNGKTSPPTLVMRGNVYRLFITDFRIAFCFNRRNDTVLQFLQVGIRHSVGRQNRDCKCD